MIMKARIKMFVYVIWLSYYSPFHQYLIKKKGFATS